MALLRGSDLVGLPIVTLGGDDIAEVRDVLFDAVRGVLMGFTLNKRGRLGGRMSDVLLQANVVAVGPNAIVVPTAQSLTEPNAKSGAGAPSTEADAAMREPIGNVLADRVLTDSGVVVGTVTDVVIESITNTVVGFEIAPAEQRPSRNGRKSYLPFHDTRSVSSDTLIVPAAAIAYITSDFAGFAEAIDHYREALAASRVSS